MGREPTLGFESGAEAPAARSQGVGLEPPVQGYPLDWIGVLFPTLDAEGDSRMGEASIADWRAEPGALLLVELEDLDREGRQRVEEMIADAGERAFYGDDLGGIVESIGGLGVGGAEADELACPGQFALDLE